MTSPSSQTKSSFDALVTSTGRAPCLGLALVAAAGLWLGLGSTVALLVL